MDEIERIEEERFVESMIHLWIQPDAPKWIVDYVRQELRKQRGLSCLVDQDDTETAKVLRKQADPEKPPMGVKPFFIAIPDRIRELSEAISRNPESENVGQMGSGDRDARQHPEQHAGGVSEND